MVALHFAPHPDDELLGAPATLIALRDAGFRVVNVACSLGRSEQYARREAELRDACERVEFELRVPPQPVSMSSRDDRGAARPALRRLVAEEIDELGPKIVLSPSLDDPHPAHRLVAGAVRATLEEQATGAPRWWAWSLWGALSRPTLGTLFDEACLEEILTALGAHRGELARNDYRRLVRARAELNACLAPELLFGFGAVAPPDARYAEVLTELARGDGRWLLGQPQWLDPGSPLREPSGDEVAVGDLRSTGPLDADRAELEQRGE